MEVLVGGCGLKTWKKKAYFCLEHVIKNRERVTQQRELGKCSDLGQVEHEYGMIQWSDQDAVADKVGEHIILSDFALWFKAIGASAETWGREQEQKESNHDFKTDFVRNRVLANDISATRDARAMHPRTKLKRITWSSFSLRTASRCKHCLRQESEIKVPPLLSGMCGHSSSDGRGRAKYREKEEEYSDAQRKKVVGHTIPDRFVADGMPLRAFAEIGVRKWQDFNWMSMFAKWRVLTKNSQHRGMSQQCHMEQCCCQVLFTHVSHARHPDLSLPPGSRASRICPARKMLCCWFMLTLQGIYFKKEPANADAPRKKVVVHVFLERFVPRSMPLRALWEEGSPTEDFGRGEQNHLRKASGGLKSWSLRVNTRSKNEKKIGRRHDLYKRYLPQASDVQKIPSAGGLNGHFPYWQSPPDERSFVF